VSGNREAKLAHVNNGTCHQILAYRDDRYVGWCQYGRPAGWPPSRTPRPIKRIWRSCLPKIEGMDENYLPVVVGAAVVGDHVLRLLFSDGTVGDVDFSFQRWTGVLEPLNDPAYFAQAAAAPEAGTLVWPGGIDLAPEPLYEQAKAHPLVAV